MRVASGRISCRSGPGRRGPWAVRLPVVRPRVQCARGCTGPARRATCSRVRRLALLGALSASTR
eukprot:14761202-Alexandrium_andersonii.AAC.1